MEATVNGIIYALHNGDGVPRYIGLTSQEPRRRLNQHRAESKVYINRHVSVWIRKHGAENIQMEVLEEHMGITMADLKAREVVVIAEYKSNGADLTNGNEGGACTPRRVYHPDERNLRSKMYTGEGNPFFGKAHTEESKKRISESKQGQGLGVKRGPMSEEQKAKLSAAKMGTPSHNKGKVMSDEQKAKISASRAGKGYVGGTNGGHSRWHVKRGVVNPDCSFCVV